MRRMLRTFRADIDVALALTGNTSVAQLDRTALYSGMHGAVEPATG